MKHVKISSDKLTGPTIEIEGKDVTDDIRGIQVTLGFGQPTRAMVEFEPRASVFEADAVVQVVDPERDRFMLVEFLQSVDAAWLEQAMLTEDMGQGVGASALAALLGKARAEHGS